MSLTKKIVIEPEEFDTQTNPNLKENHKNKQNEVTTRKFKKSKKSKKYDFKIGKSLKRQNDDKILRNMIKISSNLYKKDAFDSSLQIKNRHGNVVKNSNLISLLKHSMADQNHLIGEEEFIQQLLKCNVNPNLILNKKIKAIIRMNRNNEDKINFEKAGIKLTKYGNNLIINEKKESRPHPSKSKTPEIVKKLKENIPPSLGYKSYTFADKYHDVIDHFKERKNRRNRTQMSDDDIKTRGWIIPK